MNITFRVRFHSRFGQRLYLLGEHALLGGGRVDRAVPMSYLDTEFWEAQLELPSETLPHLNYHYVLQEADGTMVHDWGQRAIILRSKAAQLLVVDTWNFAGFHQNAFYTEPFQEVLLAEHWTAVTEVIPETITHTFRARTPLLPRGQTLCLMGNCDALGNWSTSKPILLHREPADDTFAVHLDLTRSKFPVEYKYGVFDVEHRVFVRYEDGPNRLLRQPHSLPGTQTLLNDGFALLPPPDWRGAGVAIPVFSLRGEHSLGVGEFADLKRLADWAAKVGLKLIQILPVNDTTATHTWTDSYPYAAISAFALHPIYLRLDDLVPPEDKATHAELDTLRQKLVAPGHLDYEAVTSGKLQFLRRLFPKQRSATLTNLDYREFFEQNREWLVPYAAFCHFRDHYETSDYSRWPSHNVYIPLEIERLFNTEADLREDMEFCYFLQYHLHRQLRDAAAYTHQHGIILKGDIAIGVHRYGADTWENPHLFHMEKQAGAPPDPFADKGQNWGFPTYNWEQMQADDFAWWRRRFEQMGRYFDAFRIDHILGFFRIWSIPLHALEGILGCFVRALPVLVAELEQRGIAFDEERFTNPWITDEVLDSVFAELADQVRHDYLEATPSGCYRLKPDFRTQRQVAEHFAALPQLETSNRLRDGLFDLISNVILLPDDAVRAGPTAYHFRYGVEGTSSFKALDPFTQDQLRSLYLDYFFRRQDAFWMAEGMSRLPALKRATNMLVCGEDLGMVPPCVPEAMRQLGLLSLEIQRMPKILSARFFRPSNAPYLSVVTPSTHDMSTIRGWWREDRAVTETFFCEELGRFGTAPGSCEPWINRLIVHQHLSCPAMWSIFQLQDLLGMDHRLRWPNEDEERINVPANPRHYWRYRMHLTLEKLLQATEFNRELATMIFESGRGTPDEAPRPVGS